MQTTDAVEMAAVHSIDPKRFRAALRRAGLDWHVHNERWKVSIGSREHADMVRVLATLAPDRVFLAEPRTSSIKPPPARGANDEAWIIDICDDELRSKGLRQHRFSFLLGDPGRSGRRVPLPVDAYYPALGLVVEYHERQHTQRVSFFDDRATGSGVKRDEQRRRYDNYRRTLLPRHGLRLVIFDYLEFDTTGAGRLQRTPQDRRVVVQRLRDLTKLT